MKFDLELYREYVDVEPGVTISYIDIAPERPIRTFLFIHGFGGNARQWEYQIDKFAQKNHVIAIDLRGHGGSSRGSSINYDLEQLIADIIIVLNQAQVYTKFILVGHSFGVAIATELATRHADRVSHLVLIAGAGEYSIRWPYKAAFRFPARVLSAAQGIVDNFIDASLVSLQKMYFQTLRNWRGWEKFPKIAMPTLIILGNRDQVLPQEAYQRVVDLIPQEHSEVVHVNVSAHLVMLERRDAVNRAIERLIESSYSEDEAPRWRARLDISSRGSLLRERPWLAYYETDIPATIHVPDHPLTRLLRRSSRRFPNRTALNDSGRKLTYRALYNEVLRFANGLIQVGAQKNCRIMILLPNCMQLVVAYYGILETGAIVTMANPLAGKEELLRQLDLLQANILVTWKNNPFLNSLPEETTLAHIILTDEYDYAAWYRKWINKLNDGPESGEVIKHIHYSYWSQMMEKSMPEPLDVMVQAKDTAVIQFTGGISGPPKGVELTHKNLVANVLQMRAWFHNAQDGQETTVALMPLSHVYGMTTAMNYPISQGATIILSSQFEIDDLMMSIRKHEPTYFPAIPSIFMAIKDYPDVRRYNVGKVRTFLSSVSPLPIEVEEAFEKVTRSHIIEAYGLTEASPMTHISPLDRKDKIGSIGLPLPSTEARIVDLETKRVLPPGQVGELLIRGPQVMQGYWRDDAATARAIDGLGWLSTGDIARMDNDGYFQIISKSQEVWHSPEGDARFYPRDIEEVIYELPSVEEVVVVILAGRPVAFVKVKDKTEITTNSIIAYCRRRLPSELVPWRVVFAGDFPRNLIGRVRRQELVDEYQKEVLDRAGRMEQLFPGLKEAKFAEENL